jgi:DNA invertase Pin-like site-specific DNA recombinase
MKIGYARVSKSDGSQTLDLQIDALISEGIDESKIYTDKASGKKDDRPGLLSCLKSLRKGDVLVVWKLDRIGRNLPHLVEIVNNLHDKDIGLKVIAGLEIDTTSAQGKLFFTIFAGLAEYESNLISERTKAGLAAARKRGIKGGRKHSLSPAQVRVAVQGMKNRDTSISSLCKELEITKPTLYSYVDGKGNLRKAGKAVLNIKD